MRRIFVTATDTGAGKTVISAGIARAFAGKSLSVGVMKPVASGSIRVEGEKRSMDALYLIGASGTTAKYEDVNPYCLKLPLSPNVAAEKEGVVIDIDRICHSFERLCDENDVVIIEGIGGVMVPIRDDFCVLDLIALLKLPVLIVSRPGLGTINHSLLTIEALKKRGVLISGIVFNKTEKGESGEAEETSPGVIERISLVKSFGTVPYDSGVSVEGMRYGKVVDEFSGIFIDELGGA